MVVILCHPDDGPALWLDGAWRAAGVRDHALVSVEQLVYSTSFVHHMDGAADTGAVRLADGRVLRPERITGLVNRVRALPTEHFARADATDRAYASAELAASLLAWINGVAGRAINPPQPTGLGGAAIQPVTLAYCAAMAGLPTAPWRACADPRQGGTDPAPYLPATHSVVVLDHRVFGAILPAPVQDGCRRLAALLGLPLLQVLLHQSPTAGWRFAGASGLADVRVGGRPLAAALAHACGAVVPEGVRA
jgi:hypothetical protein